MASKLFVASANNISVINFRHSKHYTLNNSRIPCETICCFFFLSFEGFLFQIWISESWQLFIHATTYWHGVSTEEARQTARSILDLKACAIGFVGGGFATVILIVEHWKNKQNISVLISVICCITFHTKLLVEMEISIPLYPCVQEKDTQTLFSTQYLL